MKQLKSIALNHTEPLNMEKVGSQSSSRSPEQVEIDVLTREMAKGIKEMIDYYVRYSKMTPDEAREEALKPLDELTLQRATRPDCARWYTLGQVAYDDPEKALELWRIICQRARDEFEAGVLAAEAVGKHGAWERAQFLAIRETFIDEWQPRGGIELCLIDQLVQCYDRWMYWLYELDGIGDMIRHDRFILDEEESARVNDPVYVKDKYRTPRQADVQTRDDAIKNADRFQRMFMRTLRALRDLRRYNVNVTITGAANVNVGPQQVNVGAGDARKP